MIALNNGTLATTGMRTWLAGSPFASVNTFAPEFNVMCPPQREQAVAKGADWQYGKTFDLGNSLQVFSFETSRTFPDYLTAVAFQMAFATGGPWAGMLERLMPDPDNPGSYRVWKAEGCTVKSDGAVVNGVNVHLVYHATVPRWLDCGSEVPAQDVMVDGAGHALIDQSGGNTFSPQAVEMPVSITAPMIDNLSPLVGTVLHVTPATWIQPLFSVTRQWKRGGVAISGATGTSYTTVAADATQAITVSETVVSIFGGTTTITTVATAPVDGSPRFISGPAAVSGGSYAFPITGDVITCSAGVYAGGPSPTVSYLWNDASATTTSPCTVHSGDKGRTLVCVVTITNSAGTRSMASNGILVPAAPVNTVAPVITNDGAVSGNSGSPAVPGDTLSVSNGTWANSATDYSYLWSTGEMTQTVLQDENFTGALISCTVQASNADGTTAVDAGNLIDRVLLPLNVIPPSVVSNGYNGLNGPPVPGDTLTLAGDTWLNSPDHYEYVWKGVGASTSDTTLPYYDVTGVEPGPVYCTVLAYNTWGASDYVDSTLMPMR